MSAAWQEVRQGLKCPVCFSGVTVVIQGLYRLKCLSLLSVPVGKCPFLKSSNLSKEIFYLIHRVLMLCGTSLWWMRCLVSSVLVLTGLSLLTNVFPNTVTGESKEDTQVGAVISVCMTWVKYTCIFFFFHIWKTNMSYSWCRVLLLWACYTKCFWKPFHDCSVRVAVLEYSFQKLSLCPPVHISDYIKPVCILFCYPPTKSR